MFQALRDPTSNATQHWARAQVNSALAIFSDLTAPGASTDTANTKPGRLLGKRSGSGVPEYQVSAATRVSPCQSPSARYASPAVSARSRAISTALSPSLPKPCTDPCASQCATLPLASRLYPSTRSDRGPGFFDVNGAGNRTTPSAIATGASAVITVIFAGTPNR